MAETKLIAIDDIPKPYHSPFLVANDQGLVVSYPGPKHLHIMIVFDGMVQHTFGDPNSEALNGHPLWSYGLQHFAVYEVMHSPWIAELEKRNSVHPSHHPSLYEACRHFIFSFEDSTLEVVAQTYSVSSQEKVTLQDMNDALRL